MAESGGAGTCPQVFVVDSLANYDSVPSGRKQRWARAGQKLLLLLVGVTILGLAVEGYLIYHLYKKSELSLQAFSQSMSHSPCQNSSHPKTSGQQGGTAESQVGQKGSNEISSEQTHTDQRPFAQLLGAKNPVGENNVVQWTYSGGETVINNMDYNNGRLLVKKEGHYYLFSKVTLNAVEECSLIQHRVMRTTKAYGMPIELMKSQSNRCRTTKSSNARPSDGEDLWNSFLAGIFHLNTDDEIYVTLVDITKMRPGITENLMGAFMISD